MERYWHWKKVISLEMKRTRRMDCLHKSVMNAKLSQQRYLPLGLCTEYVRSKGGGALEPASVCKTGFSAFCAIRLEQNRFEICP